jgi:hypothetical protein
MNVFFDTIDSKMLTNNIVEFSSHFYWRYKIVWRWLIKWVHFMYLLNQSSSHNLILKNMNAYIKTNKKLYTCITKNLLTA